MHLSFTILLPLIAIDFTYRLGHKLTKQLKGINSFWTTYQRVSYLRYSRVLLLFQGIFQVPRQG
jgi:hypothetical protein